ncbi:MAG: hypothetical protein ISEC1_P2037 [Thiomicrorhabdus sp.]|nr:MAG: hypothetical protein ISEC1_P2037 [Thiomicrorhabdus sp.]
MNELNNDWVLWMGVGTIVISVIVVFVSGRKLFSAMDGNEEGE